jgi:hypothetical protein
VVEPTPEGTLDMSQKNVPGEPRRRPANTHDDIASQATSVFVPAPGAPDRGPRRWLWLMMGFLAVVAIGAVGVMVAWPRLKPRKLDPVERVAENFLKALVNQDAQTAGRLGTVEEPPAIRSVGKINRDRRGNRTLKGSFAPLGAFHKKIEAEFAYDSSAGRFTPKNALGAAGETMDALHAAKEEAEKSGLYKKMQSGDPDDLFDAAEQYAKVFTKLAETTLAPKRILPTYKMLVESAKPPLPSDAQALALEVAGSQKDWDALLKRSFHTLKADGPFIFERAEVTAIVTDRLASLGDPPTKLRVELVRFRLEGIDTEWKVVSAKRILPGATESQARPSAPKAGPSGPKPDVVSPGEVQPSLGNGVESR